MTEAIESKIKDACGVVGLIHRRYQDDLNEQSYLNFLCLNALQHRGQESCGIISVNSRNQLFAEHAMGLVSHLFDEARLARLPGHLSLGHVRYSTTGSSDLNNAQPIVLRSAQHPFEHLTLGHNGNLINTARLRAYFQEQNTRLSSQSDSEVLALLIQEELIKAQLSPEPRSAELLNLFKSVLNKAKGAFSLCVSLGKDWLIGVRDPFGIRPLVLGKLGNESMILASETCALDMIGADLVREVEPGEIVMIDRNLNTFSTFLPSAKSKLCLFELIYFARPDSTINNIQVHAFREALGIRLAEVAPPPPNADLVIGVPDSGTPAAIGYARHSRLPFSNGLIKNRYIGRTFIQPSQAVREMGIRLKLNPLPAVIKGKSVILIDDSIVRGNTPRQLVKLLRNAGAREVHFRISSPPIRWGCFYGINMTDSELIARRLNGQIQALCQEIEADSLAFLDLKHILALPGIDPEAYCHACFSGQYPAGTPQDYRSLGLDDLDSKLCDNTNKAEPQKLNQLE